MAFRRRSRAFHRVVADAARWMMKRHVGMGHWWRWQVLTARNPDSSRRPILDDRTAQDVFSDLERRGLLVEVGRSVDGSDVPAYVMRYDLEGWDEAISAGRPVFGAWLKFRRTWAVLVVAFFLGVFLAIVENRTSGLIQGQIDSWLGGGAQREEVVGGNDLTSSTHGAAGNRTAEGTSPPPNQATAPDG